MAFLFAFDVYQDWGWTDDALWVLLAAPFAIIYGLLFCGMALGLRNRRRKAKRV